MRTYCLFCINMNESIVSVRSAGYDVWRMGATTTSRGFE